MKIVQEVSVNMPRSRLFTRKPKAQLIIKVVQFEEVYSFEQVETALRKKGLRLVNTIEARAGIRDANLQSRWPITHCEPGIAVLVFTLNEKRERVMVAYPWGVIKEVANGFFMAVENSTQKH